MLLADIQKDQLKEQKLQFIRAHQQAFDVEPLYPLRLFEDLTMEVEGDCSIEASCKVELDKLIASRFLIFFPNQTKAWQQYLNQILAFFKKVERRVGIELDYSPFKKFLGNRFDFNKIVGLSCGVDLRKNLAESSLKMHIRVQDYPEKIETAFILSDGAGDREYLQDFVSLIGFDFYFNGKSEIELYAEVAEADFYKSEIQNRVWRHFPRSVLAPLEASHTFIVGLSKANHNPVLYYNLKDRQSLSHYFKLNDTAQRVQSFYQHQEILPNMWVATAQTELEKTRIDNIRLYYYKFFGTNG